MIEPIDELSVFFPSYNEEGNIEKVVNDAKKVLLKVAKKWEIIIVNDGSKDNTSKIAHKLSESDKRIKTIDQENRGYGGALKTGLYDSQYDFISFTDADGQFDFGEITNFIEEQRITKADIVIGYYKKRQVSKFVILTSKLWEVLVFILFRLHVTDVDCGFKLISKKVIEKIPQLESERGAFISSELLLKARKFGFKIVEIPVTHYPRRKGTPTGRKLNVIIKSFIDLGKLWVKLNFG